jgi:hypothetical protein
MNLEYLAEGLRDCPLIRLYGFNQAEARSLKNLVRSLATGERDSAQLRDETWIESVGGCRLSLRRGMRNQAVREIEPFNFEYVLTSSGWSNVEGLLDPFCNSQAAGFQWLTNEGRVSLLISQDGHW